MRIVGIFKPEQGAGKENCLMLKKKWVRAEKERMLVRRLKRKVKRFLFYI